MLFQSSLDLDNPILLFLWEVYIQYMFIVGSW